MVSRAAQEEDLRGGHGQAGLLPGPDPVAAAEDGAEVQLPSAAVVVLVVATWSPTSRSASTVAPPTGPLGPEHGAVEGRLRPGPIRGGSVGASLRATGRLRRPRPGWPAGSGSGGDDRWRDRRPAGRVRTGVCTRRSRPGPRPSARRPPPAAPAALTEAAPAPPPPARLARPEGGRDLDAAAHVAQAHPAASEAETAALVTVPAGRRPRRPASVPGSTPAGSSRPRR